MPNLKIDLIENQDAFDDLEADWRSLLERCPHSVFQTWEYVSLWLRHYHEGVQLYVVVLRDVLGVPHAIAPFIKTVGQGRIRKHLQHLTLVGGLSESLAEHVDFLIAPGWEEEFFPLLGKLLLQEDCFEADSLYLELQQAGAAGSSAFLRFVQRELSAFGRPEVRGRYLGYFCDFSAGWASFQEGIPTKFRAQLRRAKEQLAERGVEFCYAGTEASAGVSLEEAWAFLIASNLDKWTVGQNVYRSQRFLGFHRDLSALFAEKGWLAMPVMKVAGEIVSIRYDFFYRGIAYGFQGGWDSGMAKYKPGQLLFEWFMQDAAENWGCTEFDFMAGGWDYQKPWKSGARDFFSFEVLNPATLKGGIFSRLRSIKHKIREARAASC
jgi:hypothetical protein